MWNVWCDFWVWFYNEPLWVRAALVLPGLFLGPFLIVYFMVK